MDRQKCQVVLAAIRAALNAVATDLNVFIELGGGRFSDTRATFKVEITEKQIGDIQDKKQQDFNAHCVQFGLKASDFGRTFQFQGRIFTICGIKPRSWKFPILAKDGRGIFKFAAASVKLYLEKPSPQPVNATFPTSKKRTAAEILAELRDVEGRLSPENLTCDGEAPRTWVAKEGARLNALRRKLIAELGRTPTHEEIWGKENLDVEPENEEDENPYGLTEDEQIALNEFRKVYSQWKRVLQELWAGRQKSAGVIYGATMLSLKDKLEEHLSDM